MSAYLWLAKLNIQPDNLCRCGHTAKMHLHGKSCSEEIENFKFCKCIEFREGFQIQTEGDEMGKKEKKVRKPKSEGRKPVLAEFVKEGFNIFASYKGKEIDARVRADGVIVFKDKEYATPNAAGMAATGRDHGIDGYRFWRFKKNGEEVALDAIRGSKSPLKLEAPKPKSEKKTKAAKPNGSAKPKRSSPRKRRADREATLAPATQQAEAVA
jgi:hypothetical protein